MIRTGKIDPAISKRLAREIREIGKRAHNEEEVRVGVELALKPILTQLGISAQANYEQKLTTLQGTGYADAVYGFGIIEYERPGKIATPAGRKEVIEQLSSYLTSKARELAPSKPQEAVKKMIGIGLDGEQVIYLRVLVVAQSRSIFPANLARNAASIFQRKRSAAWWFSNRWPDGGGRGQR